MDAAKNMRLLGQRKDFAALGSASSMNIGKFALLLSSQVPQGQCDMVQMNAIYSVGLHDS